MSRAVRRGRARLVADVARTMWGGDMIPFLVSLPRVVYKTARSLIALGHVH